MNVNATGARGPTRSLELELQVTVSHLMWVLGTKPLSSEGATVCALNHQAVSRALNFVFLPHKNPDNCHLPDKFIHFSCLCLFYLVPLLLVDSLVYLVGRVLFLFLPWDPAQCLLHMRSTINRICGMNEPILSVMIWI